MIPLQSSLGIYFGKDHILLVHLKKTLKEVVLNAYDMIQIPSDLTEEELDGFLSQEVSRFINDKGIGRENVWICLPRNETLFRFLTLPFSAEENLREVIRYEIEKYIPFPEEEVYFDFLVLERDGEGKKLKLLFLVIKKMVLERYLSILQKAGISPFGVEVSSISLLNLFLLGKNGGADRPVAFVNIERLGFEVNWVSQGILRYSRANAFASEKTGDQFEHVMEELRNGFRAGFPLQVWRREGNIGPLVFLSGDGTRDDLINEFSSTGDMEIQSFVAEDIAPSLKFSETFPKSLALGIGLALRGIHKVPFELNLLPQPLRKKIRKTGLYLSFFLFIAALALTLTWGLSTIVNERLELRKAEKEINSLKEGVLAVQKIQQEAQSIAEKIESLNKIQQSEVSKLEILRELSTILPSTAWIAEFMYRKNELELGGLSTSASGLIGILDSSSLFQGSEFTAPINRDPEGKENFRIKTKIKGR